MARQLEGTFAGSAFRRRERRWQRAGLGLLIVLVAGALTGVYSQPATVGRAAAIYVFLLVIFRIAGRRSLAQITNFDLVLVLILGDATQQAIIGDDYSVATGAVAVATLFLLDVTLAVLKRASPRIDAAADSLPLILVAHGTPNQDSMAAEEVGIDDILAAARETHGLTALDEIEFAVLECSGGISIVPAARRAQGRA